MIRIREDGNRSVPLSAEAQARFREYQLVLAHVSQTCLYGHLSA